MSYSISSSHIWGLNSLFIQVFCICVSTCVSSDNLNAGFRIQLWATEWQQLSSEASNEYKEKTKIIGKKCAAVNCLRKKETGKILHFFYFRFGCYSPHFNYKPVHGYKIFFKIIGRLSPGLNWILLLRLTSPGRCESCVAWMCMKQAKSIVVS